MNILSFYASLPVLQNPKNLTMKLWMKVWFESILGSLYLLCMQWTWSITVKEMLSMKLRHEKESTIKCTGYKQKLIYLHVYPQRTLLCHKEMHYWYITLYVTIAISFWPMLKNFFHYFRVIYSQLDNDSPSRPNVWQKAKLYLDMADIGHSLHILMWFLNFLISNVKIL